MRPQVVEWYPSDPTVFPQNTYGRRRSQSRSRKAQGGERAPQVAARAQRQSEGEREGRRLGLRARTFSGDPLQGAVDQAARHGGRDPRLPQGARRGAEGETRVAANRRAASDQRTAAASSSRQRT